MLSIELMLEMGRRVQPDRQFWRPETGVMVREAARQAGYCLDAPDDIPAGGMYSAELTGGETLPMPMFVDRHSRSPR